MAPIDTDNPYLFGQFVSFAEAFAYTGEVKLDSTQADRLFKQVAAFEKYGSQFDTDELLRLETIHKVYVSPLSYLISR